MASGITSWSTTCRCPRSRRGNWTCCSRVSPATSATPPCNPGLPVALRSITSRPTHALERYHTHYAFMRDSEYASTDPQKMLTQERVCIWENAVRLAVPFSKTMQLGESSNVTVGATNNNTCPVAALGKYAQLRPQVPGAYFRYQSRQPLRPSDMNDLLRRALPGQKISSHSLRIGAGTAAGRNGLPPYVIQRAGRWRSNADL